MVLTARIIQRISSIVLTLGNRFGSTPFDVTLFIIAASVFRSDLVGRRGMLFPLSYSKTARYDPRRLLTHFAAVGSMVYLSLSRTK